MVVGSTSANIIAAYESGGMTAVMEMAGYDDKNVRQAYMEGIRTVPLKLRDAIRRCDWNTFRDIVEKWYKIGSEMVQIYPHFMYDGDKRFKEVYGYLEKNPMIAIEPIRRSSGSASRSTTNRANKLTSQEASRFVEGLEVLVNIK